MLDTGYTRIDITALVCLQAATP